jgi:hypothetical protein
MTTATTVTPAALVTALVDRLVNDAVRRSGRDVVYGALGVDASRAVGALDTLMAAHDVLPGDADDVLDRFVAATSELLHALGVGR